MRIISLIAAFYILLAASVANACSCIGYEDIEQHIEANDAIFVGTAVRTRTTLLGLRYGSLRRLTRFRILESLKGVDSDTIDIFHGEAYIGSCGLDFEKGEIYFVFADLGDDGRLSTSICNAPGSVREYQPDIVDQYRTTMGRN